MSRREATPSTLSRSNYTLQMAMVFETNRSFLLDDIPHNFKTSTAKESDYVDDMEVGQITLRKSLVQLI